MAKGTTETKTIDTLVQDIYNLFTSDKGTVAKEEDLKLFAESVVSSVVSSLTERRSEEQYKKLRLSLIGHPNRKIWYTVNRKTEKQNLSGPTLIKFLYGDILEHLLILLCKTAGHKVEELQKELEVAGVKGHHDAIVDDFLVDFKSASPYGFKKFKEGHIVHDDPFGYIAQISAYAKANGKTEAAFVAIEKSSGEICVCPVNRMEMINPETRINEIKTFLKNKEPPPKCYDPVPDGKSGNMRLAVGCDFCDFKRECWKDANGGKGLRTFAYASGQKTFTEIYREPDVPEIMVDVDLSESTSND